MLLANMHPGWRESVGDVPLNFGTFWWWAYGGISVFLVCFAGIMSGLTLGLMSLGLMDIEVLQRSGTATEKRQAGKERSLDHKQQRFSSCTKPFLHMLSQGCLFLNSVFCASIQSPMLQTELIWFRFVHVCFFCLIMYSSSWYPSTTTTECKPFEGPTLCEFLIRMTSADVGILLTAAILPVVQKQHQLLVTLLLSNAVAMEVFDCKLVILMLH